MMITLHEDEVRLLSKLAAIELSDDEIASFTKQLHTLLDYTAMLEEAEPNATHEAKCNVNEFRDDKVTPTHPDAMLRIAPDTEDNYFVVPKILG